MVLTQKDFDQIERVLDEKLDEKLKNLPTKNEFFSKMDEVMGELKTTREEQTTLSHQLSSKLSIFQLKFRSSQLINY